MKNGLLHRGRQKGFKSEVPGDTMTRHGVHMGPQGCPGEAQGSPKASQNLSGKGDGKRVWQLSRTGFSAKSVSVVEESLERKETFIMTMYR